MNDEDLLTLSSSNINCLLGLIKELQWCRFTSTFADDPLRVPIHVSPKDNNLRIFQKEYDDNSF